MPSFTVENYIKAIYALSQKNESGVSTNAIAEALGTKPATVSDMLKKLKESKLIAYERYQGTTLSKTGKKLALNIIRKHRLWEVFLVEKLDFKWDEVHDIAEELEHIDSEELINRLETFLGNPKFDPHGDPIPDQSGHINRRNQVALTTLTPTQAGVITGVKDSSKSFLQYLDQLQLELGTVVTVEQVIDYDQSRIVKVEGKRFTLSQQVCRNLFVIQQ
jgi:DtxR family Mn-dependent transcriptional regulator